MENNTITRKKRKRIWPIEIIAGLFIMMIVFFIAVNVDIKLHRKHFQILRIILMNSATALQDLILRQNQEPAQGN